MPLPIALQLYTVRDELARDFEGTLAKVAKLGFTHVEFAGLYDRPASKARQLCDQLGLKVTSAHVGVSTDEKQLQQVADDAKALGCSIVVSGLPDWDMRTTAAGYRQASKILGQASQWLARQGITYAYHHHSFEFEPLDDTPGNGKKVRGIDILFDQTQPPIAAQIDVYWVKHGHDDPIAWIKKLAGRVPLLHMKDMANNAERTFTEVGTGTIDMKAIVNAAPAAGVKYLIVEQDGLWKGSPLESARISLENLKKIVG